MVKTKKAMRLLATFLLLGALAFAVGWAEITVRYGGTWFYKQSDLSAQANDKPFPEYNDGKHNPMIEPEYFPEHLQCVDPIVRHGGSWKVHLKVESTSTGSRLDAEFELEIPSPGILADCLRKDTFTGDGAFVRNHFGYLSVSPSVGDSALALGKISVVSNMTENTAKVRATGTAAAHSGDFTVYIARGEPAWRNAMLLGDVAVTTMNASITTAEGASIRRQDATSTEFTLADYNAPISMVVSPTFKQSETTTTSTSQLVDQWNTLLLFPVVGLFPWIAFLLISRKSATTPTRKTARNLFGWLTLTVAVTGPLAYLNLEISILPLVIVFVTVPTALLLLYTRTDLTKSGPFVVTFGATIVIALLALVGIGLNEPRVRYVELAAAAAACLAAGTLLPVLVPRVLGNWRRGLLLGAASLAGLLTFKSIVFPLSFLSPIGLAPWAIATYVVIRRWSGGRALAVGGAVITLLCMAPVQLALTNWSRLNLFVLSFSNDLEGNVDIAMTMLHASKLVLFIYLTRLLWLARDRPDELDSAVLKAAAIGCALVVVHDTDTSSQYTGVLIAVALTIGFLVLIHNDRNAVRLAAVTPATHARLLRLDARRRSMLDYATTHYRTARAKVAAHEVTPDDAMATQRMLDTGAGLFRPRDSDGVMLLRAAQGSAGGNRSGRNALFGALAGALISLPFTVYEALPLIRAILGETMPVQIGSPLLMAIEGFQHLRWIVYAALFGYFYPAIRCATPTTKAMALLAVVLPAELVSIDLTTQIGTLLLAAGIKAGFALFYCLSLGLAWEWWLAGAASVRWGRIRDFTRLKSFLVPVSTIIIAGVTALATAFASAAVQELLQPPPKPTEQTGPQTPGPSAPPTAPTK